MMHTFVPRGRSVQERVVVHVYDLADVNESLHWAGVGAYHSGLVVYGREHTFGGGDMGGTGVFDHAPGDLPNKLREVVVVGTTTKTSSEVAAVVHELSQLFLARNYDLITNNCNHFCDALCRRLCGTGIPPYVNRIAYWGSYVRCLFPRPAIEPPTQAHLRSLEQHQQQLFSGSGRTLGDNSVPSQSPETDHERRRRMAEALERRMAATPKPEGKME